MIGIPGRDNPAEIETTECEDRAITSEIRNSPGTVIVGGGLAGLAAAAGLAQNGIKVTLLESRPRFGGRASSVDDRDTGTTIDNCQHVSLGCCTNFDLFCRTLKLSHFLQTQPELYFVGPNGGVNRFRAGLWPAPLHLLGAFRRLDYLTREDLRQVSAGLRALCRVREPVSGPNASFAEWLRRHGQSERVQSRFWHVVLVSALSESLDRIDVRHARKVFVDAFLANRRGWQVRIPVVPLDTLYGTKAAEWFRQRGAELRLKAGVQRILLEEGRVAGVELRTGERLAADHVVLAVPHHRLPPLLPAPLQDDPHFAGLSQLETAPISSVHLWFDRPITDLPHAVFVERLSQWMFNRTVLASRDTKTNGPYYYQIVISASRGLSGRPQQEVIAEVVKELAAVWPQTADAGLRHSRLITEHKAVFSPRPGVDALRPAQQTPVPNLQLAGDWTATGWPATMEGAVRSGYLAAENVLRQLNRPARIVRPDLPRAILSRLLLGLGREEARE